MGARDEWEGQKRRYSTPKVFPKHSPFQSDLTDMAQVVLSPIGQPFCAWTQGSRKFAIYVHPDVLARLGMEVRVAFKRVPRRGLEIGGILVGRTDHRDETTTFWIEGFESIDSEHRSGPSYILSEPDFAHLREALTKNGAASIGIYRSQTRSQQLVLQEPDIELLERCFDRGDVLFLIACPVAAKAAFFIREDGDLKCVYEFVLGTPLAPSVPPQRPESPEPNPPEPKPPEMDQLIQPPPEIHTALAVVSRPSNPSEKEDMASEAIQLTDRQRPPGSAIEGSAIDRGLVKWLGGWLGRGVRFKKRTWLAAALIFSAFLGAGIGLLSHSAPPSIHPQRLPSEDLHLTNLHLTVEGNGGFLRLHWDQNSSAIRNSSRAVLHIQDGDYQIVRNLSPSEFSAGSFAYEPRSRDVTFRVDVSSPMANASGSVQVVRLFAPSAITPARPPEPILKPSASQPTKELLSSKNSTVRSEAASAIPVTKEAEKEEIRPTAARSSDGTGTAAPITRDAAPAVGFEKEPKPPTVERAAVPISVPEPSVRVWTEPVAGSAWGRLVGRVPLVRRLRKPAKTSMAGPIFQAQPVLTNPAKSSITRPVSVDVRVDVGETGMVESAEVIEFGDPLNVALANSALAAAVRWTFEPARVEDLAVASKVILHFRFTP